MIFYKLKKLAIYFLIHVVPMWKFSQIMFIMYVHLQTRLRESKFTELDLFDDFFIVMVQWSSSLLMLFLLVHHQILAQMLELLELFLHEQWHFCKAKIATWPKKKKIMQILQRTFWEIMAQSQYIWGG